MGTENFARWNKHTYLEGSCLFFFLVTQFAYPSRSIEKIQRFQKSDIYIYVIFDLSWEGIRQKTWTWTGFRVEIRDERRFLGVRVPVDLRIEGARIVCEFFQFGQLVDQIDTYTLGLAAWLHYPRAGRIAMEDLDEHLVIGGEDKGHGYDVQVLVTGTAYAQFRIWWMALRQRIATSLQIFAIALDVLD